MLDALKVPTMAVVENMSYFQCPGSEVKHRIFGPGYTESLVERFGIKNSFEVPIREDISRMSDNGTPFVMCLPDHEPIVETYTEMAKCVDRESQILAGEKQDL